jgi:hypothetical protein
LYLLQEKISKLKLSLDSISLPCTKADDCKTKFNEMEALLYNNLVNLETKIGCVQTFYASFWAVGDIHSAMIANFDGRGSILSLCQCIKDTLEDSTNEFYNNNYY